jgi:hypothetical protein
MVEIGSLACLVSGSCAAFPLPFLSADLVGRGCVFGAGSFAGAFTFGLAASLPFAGFAGVGVLSAFFEVRFGNSCVGEGVEDGGSESSELSSSSGSALGFGAEGAFFAGGFLLPAFEVTDGAGFAGRLAAGAFSFLSSTFSSFRDRSLRPAILMLMCDVG